MGAVRRTEGWEAETERLIDLLQRLALSTIVEHAQGKGDAQGR